MPLHSLFNGEKTIRKKEWVLSEEIADSLLRLPLHAYLTVEDIEYVVE